MLVGYSSKFHKLISLWTTATYMLTVEWLMMSWLNNLHIVTNCIYHSFYSNIKFQLRFYITFFASINIFRCHVSYSCIINYPKTSDIRCTQSFKIKCLSSHLAVVCPLHWSQMLSREWRCRWSNAPTTSEYLTMLLPTKVRLYIIDLTVVPSKQLNNCIYLQLEN